MSPGHSGEDLTPSTFENHMSSPGNSLVISGETMCLQEAVHLLLKEELADSWAVTCSKSKGQGLSRMH